MEPIERRRMQVEPKDRTLKKTPIDGELKGFQYINETLTSLWAELYSKDGVSTERKYQIEKELSELREIMTPNVYHKFQVEFNRALLEQLPPQERKGADPANMSESQLETSIRSSMDKMSAGQMSELEKGATEYMMTGALKMGVGIAQTVDAFRRLGRLKEPKYPEMLTKNPTLASELNTALVQSKQDDGIARSNVDRQAAEGSMITRQIASSAGSGRGTAIMQQGAINRSSNLRQAEEMLARVRQQSQQRVDRLLGMSIQEDRSLHSERVGKYNADERRHSSSQKNLMGQLSSGVNNYFAGREDRTEGKMMGAYQEGYTGYKPQQGTAEATQPPAGQTATSRANRLMGAPPEPEGGFDAAPGPYTPSDREERRDERAFGRRIKDIKDERKRQGGF